MKLIFLIIASDDPVHIQDELTQRKTWAASNAIETIWLKGGDANHFDKNTHSLIVPIEETYNNILAKTLWGLNWCFENRNFDFLIRANVSTYFEVARICKMFEKYSPNNDLFGGYLDFVNGSGRFNYVNMFVNGGAIFLSHKTVERLLKMNHLEWFGKPDDYSISQYLFNQKVKPTPISRGNLSNTGIITKRVYYRAKSSSNPVMASLRMQALFNLSKKSNPLERIAIYSYYYWNEVRFFQKNFGSIYNYWLNVYSYLNSSFRARQVIGNHEFK